MKKYLTLIFAMLGMFAVGGAIQATAQTAINGKYIYKDKTSEGNPLDSSLEIKSSNAAVLIYVSTADDYETKTRNGTWTFDKAKRMLTVTLPAITENQIKGDDQKQIYTFKIVGGNLKFVRSLYEDNFVGDVYKKL